MPAALAPLQAHISLIKRRLLIIAATIMVFFVLAFTYASDLIQWLSRPFADDLIFYGPTEALFAAIKVSFLAGVVLSLPVIFYQCWKFIEPALLPREQRMAIPVFLLAGGLFVLGLVFCNLVILPLVIQFFVGFGVERELSPQLAVGVFVDFNVKFLLILGFAFELPLILTLLARAGYVSAELLTRYRKHAMMTSLIVSAIVTPDATLYTMLLMAIPLMVMYEFGILGAKLFGQKKTPGKNADANEQDGSSQDDDVPTGTAGYRMR
jgi:sec-independent protein translocase protein TatC